MESSNGRDGPDTAKIRKIARETVNEYDAELARSEHRVRILMRWDAVLSVVTALVLGIVIGICIASYAILSSIPDRPHPDEQITGSAQLKEGN